MPSSKRKRKHTERDASSTESSSDEEERRRKKKKRKKKKKQKHEKKKVEDAASSTSGTKKKKDRKKKKRRKSDSSANDESNESVRASGAEADVKRNLMRPMTKEEWEKKQSIVRRVYDETTGRSRLIKGDGEVLEEIVSKSRHQEINRKATAGDGTWFQSKLGLK